MPENVVLNTLVGYYVQLAHIEMQPSLLASCLKDNSSGYVNCFICVRILVKNFAVHDVKRQVKHAVILCNRSPESSASEL